MTNNNSKLTEDYKAEITEILAKISLGLGKSVTDILEPKIEGITSSVKKNSQSIDSIKGNSKNTIEAIMSEIVDFKELIENNQSNNNAIIIKTVKDETTILSELINEKNEIDPILEKIKVVNLSQSVLLKNIENNSDDNDSAFAKVRESINTNRVSLKEESELLKKSIVDSNDIVNNSNMLIERNISEVLNNLQLHQERTDKTIYLLIFLVVVSSIATISLLLK